MVQAFESNITIPLAGNSRKSGLLMWRWKYPYGFWWFEKWKSIETLIFKRIYNVKVLTLHTLTRQTRLTRTFVKHVERIIDEVWKFVCMCTKNGQLFFQYRAMDMSSSFKRKDINAINDCHFTPCKEVFESPDFQFLPDQSNFNNEVGKN